LKARGIETKIRVAFVPVVDAIILEAQQEKTRLDCNGQPWSHQRGVRVLWVRGQWCAATC
jgi:hypothetical protein